MEEDGGAEPAEEAGPAGDKGGEGAASAKLTFKQQREAAVPKELPGWGTIRGANNRQKEVRGGGLATAARMSACRMGLLLISSPTAALMPGHSTFAHLVPFPPPSWTLTRPQEPAAAAAAVGRGRHRGVDPIVPFVEPEEIDEIRSFFGLAAGCPVPDALVRRRQG